MLTARNVHCSLVLVWLVSCSVTATTSEGVADGGTASDSTTGASDLGLAPNDGSTGSDAEPLQDTGPDGGPLTDAPESADTEGASDTPGAVDADSAPEAEVVVDTTPDLDAASEADTSSGEVSEQPDTSSPPSLTVAAFEALVATGQTSAITTWLSGYDGPVCDEEGCLVVTQLAKTGSDVRVLGIFGWEDADAQPMAELPGVAGTYWVVFQGLSPSAALPYKLKVDGEWTRDPSNPYVLFGGFGFDSALAPPGVGRITVVSGVVSPQLGNTRDLYVYLPAAYWQQPEARFPVLYLHDGWNVFANPQAPFGSWDVEVSADALMGSGAAAPVIMVGVDTDNRLSEYSYTPLDLGDGPIAPTGAAYADFLADTVRPRIDADFRTQTSAAVTGIAGSSLGGIISMYASWLRPDAFGRVGSFSGAYWLGEPGSGPLGTTMRELIDDNLLGLGPADLRVYFDSGDTDGSNSAAYESDDWVYSDWTRNALIRQGWPNRSAWDTDSDVATAPTDLAVSTPVGAVPHIAWSTTITTATLDPSRALLAVVGHGHKHNEAAWKARFGAALRYLYPPQ